MPDHRGRTGLDQAGRDLDGNPRVRIVDVELLAAGWHVLRRTTLDYRDVVGALEPPAARDLRPRATAPPSCSTTAIAAPVLLTRQFRFPVYVNGHPDGMLVETAAGLLDDDDPETAIRREAAEETGVEVGELEHVFDVFMSPGSVTERIHFFAASYDSGSRHGDVAGLADEGEEIEILELDIDEALRDDPRRPHPGCEGDHAAAVGSRSTGRSPRRDRRRPGK